ncbi:hypothetical protein F4778DRAFT_510462 [Xylariomycetidae sp. FL2044]|nr:hypothetical protein F4778DRAFT_510462 [Xylariomycetidae sp. FL2044]
MFPRVHDLSLSPLSYLNPSSRSSSPMTSDEVFCFHRNHNARKHGEISLERYLRNGLAHVRGVRHARDQDLSESDVKYWALKDIVLAAIQVCMLQQNLTASQGEEDTLVQMLLNCQFGTFDTIQMLDQINGTSVLTVPVFYQIILAMTLSEGNRDLVRDLVTRNPPAPGHEMLFGTDNVTGHSWPETSELIFGESYALSHGMFQGQADNGCEVWALMLRTGWAIPRSYMLAWAASSPSPEAGMELFQILREYGFEVAQDSVEAALHYGDVSMLDYILRLYIPDNLDPSLSPINKSQAHSYLLAAAQSRRDGVEKLELLYKYGINDFQYVPEIDISTMSDPHPLSELELTGSPPFQTPLHAAAVAGNAEVVEWLIEKGAKPVRDYFDRTPYEVCRDRNHTDAMAIFEKYGLIS